MAGHRLALAVCHLPVMDQAAAIRRLGPEERQRLAGLHHPRRCRQWLGGRLAAKEALALLAANGRQENDHVEIRTGNHGEPLAARPGFTVSISHSGDHAAAVASRTGRCGVDVQTLTPTLARARSRYCRTADLRLLTRLARHLPLLSRLGILWAMKEAYRKAAGGWPLPPLAAIQVVGGRARRHHLELYATDDAGEGREALLRAWMAEGAAWAVACLLRPGEAAKQAGRTPR